MTSRNARKKRVRSSPAARRRAKSFVRKPVRKARPAQKVVSQKAVVVQGPLKRPVSAMNTSVGKQAIPPARAPLAKARLKIPPLLLEGDEPPISVAVEAPSPPPSPPIDSGPPQPAEGVLPRPPVQLFLTARDAQWLHTHWDLPIEEQRRCNQLAPDGHLVLRIYRHSRAGSLAQEVRLEPEARDWFVRVDEAGTVFVAELGYRGAGRDWVHLAESGLAATPFDVVAQEAAVRFESGPVSAPSRMAAAAAPVSVEKPPAEPGAVSGVVAPVGSALAAEAAPRGDVPQVEIERVPAAVALDQAWGEPKCFAASESGEPAVVTPAPVARWTLAQERAFGEAMKPYLQRLRPANSIELSEMIGGEQARGAGLPMPAEAAPPREEGQVMPGVSSYLGPPAAGPGPQPFWFNVNAELVIYGATEPDARVTIGNRAIPLRPDGSFSYRFALPDGIFALPAEAASARGEQRLRAELSFSRLTRYQGEVGAHAQDPALQPPLQEHL
jgi:uncharacterized protein